MDTRRVIRNKTGFYINIPLDICKALEIKKGEHLKVSYVTGVGIFITQLSGADKVPISPKSVEGLKKAADFIVSHTEARLKQIESNSITSYYTSMIEKLSRMGIFELQRKVDRLERLAVESNIEKGRLTLIREHKRKTA
jgi:hypothetical protein